MSRRFLLFIPLVLLVLALVLIGCATSIEPSEEPSEPQPEPTEAPVATAEASPVVPAATSDPLLSTPTPPPTPPATPPPPTPEIEERIAEVEWPASMRAGDNDVIRFSLIPAPEGVYVPEAELEGHEVEPAEVPMVVSRPGYTGYARATLSAAGLEAEPAGPEEQLLAAGQPNTWRWTISPPKAGTYRVVINLSVRWVPNPDADLPGPFEESAWSRTLTVEARSTLGLSGKQADLAGVGGSVVGLVSGIPFTEKLAEVLWKRLKQRLKKTEPPLASKASAIKKKE
jgi:hypothetical protein